MTTSQPPPADGPPVGRLVLCGAPIGDPRDASPRLVEALETADVIAAEDTRRFRALCRRLGVTPRGEVVSYYDQNEQARAVELLARLQTGAVVAVITDAGMPGVSDPGYRLVAAAARAGVTVGVVPGPSAVTTALAVSGLPSDRWVFEGFLPRRSVARRTRLAELAAEPRTLVLLEAPHRLADSLADAAAELGADRPAVVCRELSKTFEEIVRGTLAELAAWAVDGARGEVTLVIGGAPAPEPGALDAAELATRVARREHAGQRRKEAIAEVALEAGVAKRLVFDAVVGAKHAAGPAGHPPG
jgi:16S rRNA (cytidine1402-2'-O)-methyltransferase